MKSNKLQTVEFYNQQFLINNNVHKPRKSTEYACQLMIDSINRINQTTTIADIGTGSGVLAISIAQNCPNVKQVYATDLYKEALEVTQINIQKHKLRNIISLKQGDLLKPLLNTKVDVILANLPFADDIHLEKIKQIPDLNEPIVGMYGGPTGFELYEELFRQFNDYRYLSSVRFIWIICYESHLKLLRKIKKQYFPNSRLKTIKDIYKPYIHCQIKLT